MFSENAKNEMLDGLTVNLMSLHTGDPGAAGTANEISGDGYTRQACAFAAASGSARALNAAVDFVGPANEDVTWIGLWDSAGPTFKARIQVTAGDVAMNAAGEYKVTTATQLTLSDS